MSGRVSVSFYYSPIDAENINEEPILNQLHNSMVQLSGRILLRFTERQRQVFFDDKITTRSEDFKTIGRTQCERIITFETWAPSTTLSNLNPFSKAMRGDFSDPIELLSVNINNLNLQSFGLELKPLTEIETLKLISLPEEIYKFDDYVSLKNNPKDLEQQSRVMLFGAVRLKHLNKALSLKSIAYLKTELPQAYTLSVTFCKPMKMFSELKMRAQVKSTENAADVSNQLKNQEVASHLDRMTQGNEVPFEVEFIIGIERETEDLLKKDLNTIAKHLEWIGPSYIETYGTYQSFMAMQISEQTHLTFKELSRGSLFIMPIFSYVSSDSQKIEEKALIRLHRRSKELDSFNLFHKNTAGNTLVIGSTGRGKSFLVNALTESILQDPKINLMIIDVGSSYKKTCSKALGERYTIELDKPSGLNPFVFLKKHPHSLEICMILTSFVEALILDNNEIVLPKELAVELSAELIRYSESRPLNPSLDDFYNFAKIQRKKILSQWVGEGLYNNIFRSVELELNENQFKYFDFKSMHVAKNNDLMQATVAAVMAYYNTQIFIQGEFGDRVVLICDETKFVFEKCSAFFHVTCANSRKLGHALILINQESDSFYTKDGTGEKSESLFKNSNNHFLFVTESGEGKATFMNRHQKITEDEYQSICKLELKKGKYSEVFLKSDSGSRVLQIRPSIDEYWRWSTDKKDRDYMNQICTEFKLTEEEVIACLNMQRAKQSGQSSFVL
jgi:hypothetical protein